MSFKVIQFIDSGNIVPYLFNEAFFGSDDRIRPMDLVQDKEQKPWLPCLLHLIHLPRKCLVRYGPLFIDDLLVF